MICDHRRVGRWLVVLVTLSACGRVDFESRVDARLDSPPIPLRDDCVGYETALFCDGFEDPALAKWSVGGQAESMQIDALAPPHGARVLQSDTQTTQDASFVLARLGPFAVGTIYMRGWFYVPSNMALTHFDLFDFNSDGAGGVAALVSFGKLTLFQSTGSPATSMKGPSVPLDRWMCLTVELQLGEPGNIYLAVDGEPAASITGVDTVPGTGFQSLLTGIPWTDEGQTPVRAYSDEIIVDDKPIACD
jgi:hypothetical protein